MAEGGTIFLDEVAGGELPVDLQAKMLRAIAEKKETDLFGGARRVPSTSASWLRQIERTSNRSHQEHFSRSSFV